MTQEEFSKINWRRGNTVRLDNGKEYPVMGTKGHGRLLLLYSVEYQEYFVADHYIVDCRTSDYEEPEEVYLERKRLKKAEAQAKRQAEILERRRLREERKQRNIQEQERLHLEAVARKEATAKARALKKEAKARAKAGILEEAAIPETPLVAEPVAKAAPPVEKRKRIRIKVNRVEKVKF